jgi:hypothetical protein
MTKSYTEKKKFSFLQKVVYADIAILFFVTKFALLLCVLK